MVDILEKNIQTIIRSSDIKTFGFIIYTEENPNIIKLLKDDDYWNALDKASGEKFYIFTVKPTQGTREYPSMNNGMMGMMVKIWKEPKDNHKLLEVFEIKSTEELPLFFIFTKVGPYLLKYSVKINEKNIDEALSQLKNLFYKIRLVSEQIHSKYEEHPAQVHDKIAEVLQKENFKKAVYAVATLFGVVSKIVKAI